MKLIRDAVSIFSLYVIGDLLTTAIFLQRGGIEANPTFSILLIGGASGIIQVILIKVMVFITVILMMYTLMQLELPRTYSVFVCTILGLSIFVVVSNLMVFFVNRNIFQLLGIF